MSLANFGYVSDRFAPVFLVALGLVVGVAIAGLGV